MGGAISGIYEDGRAMEEQRARELAQAQFGDQHQNPKSGKSEPKRHGVPLGSSDGENGGTLVANSGLEVVNLSGTADPILQNEVRNTKASTSIFASRGTGDATKSQGNVVQNGESSMKPESNEAKTSVLLLAADAESSESVSNVTSYEKTGILKSAEILTKAELREWAQDLGIEVEVDEENPKPYFRRIVKSIVKAEVEKIIGNMQLALPSQIMAQQQDASSSGVVEQAKNGASEVQEQAAADEQGENEAGEMEQEADVEDEAEEEEGISDSSDEEEEVEVKQPSPKGGKRRSTAKAATKQPKTSRRSSSKSSTSSSTRKSGRVASKKSLDTRSNNSKGRRNQSTAPKRTSERLRSKNKSKRNSGSNSDSD